MKAIGIIGCLATLILAMPVSAEYYKYSDQHGNTIHTDNLNNVPGGQRAQAGPFENKPAGAADAKPHIQGQGQWKANEDDLKSEHQRLESLKGRLAEEFKSLSEENAALRKTQKEAVTPDQIKVFNRRIVSFNARYKAYKEKESVYQSQIETYKKRVKAVISESRN